MFVIIALLIFVVTFISVATVQVGGKTVRYKTYFRFAGGLQPGDVVRFGGLKSGTVKNIHPWEEDPTQIEVLLELSENVPVNQDSVATIASLSALGQNYLEISPGSMDAVRIEPGGVIPSTETVTLNDITKKIADVADTATVVMQDLQRDFELIAQDTRVLLANLQELTGEKNQRSVEQLLDNANNMVEQQAPKIDKITDQVSALLEKIDKLGDDLSLVAQNANDTVQNVNRTVEETREPLKRDLEELEATLVRARELLEQIQGIVTVNEGNINEMLENFRVASRNVEELTDELRQRPWSLIRVKPKEDRQVPLPAAGSSQGR